MTFPHKYVVIFEDEDVGPVYSTTIQGRDRDHAIKLAKRRLLHEEPDFPKELVPHLEVSCRQVS